MAYKPDPIDTSHVELPEDLLRLKELIARNAHNVWASMRIREGWTYGPRRDDVAKRHPDLVRYEDLPESEKEYDRNLAVDSIKLIIALGYKIKKA